MQKILFILLATLSFTACKNEEKTIEFKKVVNLNLGNISKENATVTATAVFMNYTDKELNLKDLVLDFTVDGKDVGTIVTKKDIVIAPKAEFSVPIKYPYETSSFKVEGHEPSTTYSVQLSGNLTAKDANNEEFTSSVKYASSYEYLTKKEIREEKRETRKEERQQKREERKHKREERKEK